MNIREGARRIRVAGWIVMLVLPLTSIVPNLIIRGFRAPLIFIPMFLTSLVPGAVILLSGWVVEGFAREG